MIQKQYKYSIAKEKNIERIIDDENINLNHMILPNGTGLPEHYSNSNVYMIITKGTMSIRLNDKETNLHGVGDIINIPYGIKMNVNNNHQELLEFFVVKSPNPKNYRGE